MAVAVGTTEVAQLKVNEKKWTPTLMKAGWTVLPNVIFERQRALGLDAIDINIILHIASYWWTKEGKPFPSKRTIAAAMEIEPRTVQRRIARLEAAKLIRREQRRSAVNGSQTNVYHLDGLIEAAKPFALEKIQAREAKALERAERVARKGKPKLAIVK
ncbi:MAG: helix-turn-helix domain-containing protein [Rhizobiales bacterium]|nr:helix-turn-helix domain-containing protein [Hyphomicrobiales bacterium]